MSRFREAMFGRVQCLYWQVSIDLYMCSLSPIYMLMIICSISPRYVFSIGCVQCLYWQVSIDLYMCSLSPINDDDYMFNISQICVLYRACVVFVLAGIHRLIYVFSISYIYVQYLRDMCSLEGVCSVCAGRYPQTYICVLYLLHMCSLYPRYVFFSIFALSHVYVFTIERVLYKCI